MALFFIASESQFEVWWFYSRFPVSELILYLWNELPNTWFWQFFLKKAISCKEFDNFWCTNDRNPWNFGKNCNRIGPNSKNLKVNLGLMVYTDVFAHCVWLNSTKVNSRNILAYFLAWIRVCSTNSVWFRSY